MICKTTKEACDRSKEEYKGSDTPNTSAKFDKRISTYIKE